MSREFLVRCNTTIFWHLIRIEVDMIADYAFKMIDGSYVGYYVHSHNRQFSLVGTKTRWKTVSYGTIYRSNKSPYRSNHMQNNLSYDALLKRCNATTYSVVRYLKTDIQDQLDEMEQELMLEML